MIHHPHPQHRYAERVPRCSREEVVLLLLVLLLLLLSLYTINALALRDF